MPLKDRLRRFTAPVAEMDQQRLRDFCASFPNAQRIVDTEPRDEITVVGQITGLRIVPRREGSPWLEATISDGTGSLVVMWTGRRKIAGVAPGKRLVVTGRGSPTGPGGRLLILNPRYELL